MILPYGMRLRGYEKGWGYRLVSPPLLRSLKPCGGDALEAGSTSARLLYAHASKVLTGFEVLQDLRSGQKNNDGNVQGNINCGPA